MIIDIATHIIPERTAKAIEAMPGRPPGPITPARHGGKPLVMSTEARLRGLEQHAPADYRQVLSHYLFRPALEEFATPEDTGELCKLANEELRSLLGAHPDRFAQALGMLPFNDPDVASREIDHLRELGLIGFQAFTDVDGKPLDHPEILPIVEEALSKGLVCFIHPSRTPKVPDFRSESRSEYGVWMVFGWPYDTAATMIHLAATGLFDRYPEAVIVTHHLGGIVPYLAARVESLYGEQRQIDHGTQVKPDAAQERASRAEKPLGHYLRLFYADTAATTPASLACGLSFFPAERVLFGSDSPLDFTEHGTRCISSALAAVEGSGAAPDVLDAVYHGNAERILSLRVPT